jgi:hypothetical protein
MPSRLASWSAVRKPMPRMSRARRCGSADAMALQEHHDLTNGLLVGPAGGDAGEPDLADAAHLQQPARRFLDDIEHRLTEGGDQPLGEMRADALDQAGGEVALDALTRGGRRHLQEQGAKLGPMLAVLLPMAAGLDVLAGMDLGGAAEHGDEIAVAAQKPLSALWKVTRSTSPERGSRSFASPAGCLMPTVPNLADSHDSPGAAPHRYDGVVPKAR